MSDNTTIIIKWRGKEYHLENISLQSSVLDIKNIIYEKTNVKPERQKLLGLKTKGVLFIFY